MKPTEDKQASKKQKMADPGYYVEYLIDEAGQISIPKEGCSVICIGDDATAKYTRYQNDSEWYTLNWNCAPSRKFMNTKQLVKVASKNNMFESRYDYYPTWQDFVDHCTKLVSPLSKRQKSPNDNFSK